MTYLDELNQMTIKEFLDSPLFRQAMNEPVGFTELMLKLVQQVNERCSVHGPIGERECYLSDILNEKTRNGLAEYTFGRVTDFFVCEPEIEKERFEFSKEE